MSRALIRSNRFIRAAKRLLKKNPEAAEALQKALQLLEEDAFHPSLKTHKLAGALSGARACSVGYDLRIIFSLVSHEGKEAVLLETMGTHDEVY